MKNGVSSHCNEDHCYSELKLKLNLKINLMSSAVPEAFYRICTLDGVLKLLPLWGLREQNPGGKWFLSMYYFILSIQ